jgi:hypothetical protein
VPRIFTVEDRGVCSAGGVHDHGIPERNFLKRIKGTAEQLTQPERWRLILSAAFQYFLGGRVLGSTSRLANAAG